MEFITTINGNYPKVGDGTGQVNLRQVLNRFDKGKVQAADVESAYQETIARVIAEQEAAGLSWVTDGQIRWDDPVTPFAKNCKGLKIGGLIRFFDNNVYYRQPSITAEPIWEKPTASPAYEYAVSRTKKPVKAAIVGPYSFARLSRDEFFHDINRCTQALAEILKRELQELTQAGAQWVQIDEPSLGFFPQDIKIARRAWETMTEGKPPNIILYTYFGDIKPIADELFSFPADVIGADVVSKPGNFDVLSEAPPNKGLMFGLLDARNTKLETVDELEKKLARIATSRKNDCWITTSCGLEFLPYKNALAKMQRLTEERVGQDATLDRGSHQGRCCDLRGNSHVTHNHRRQFSEA